MLLQIITFYVVCDTYLKQTGHQDDPQTRLTKAETMTTMLVAVWFFAGNLRLACTYLRESGLIPTMGGESRFNRPLHRIIPADWQGMLTLLAQQTPADTFVVDSCPVPVCQSVRGQRRRLYQDPNAAIAGDAYLGYCAAKDQWYYGLKVHVAVASNGRPVEVLPLCGCSADLVGLQELTLDLPAGAKLYGDKAYNDYAYEEALQVQQGLTLLPLRKDNSKRPHAPEVASRISRVRKRIETTFSQVTAKFARRIAAVTEACFESKIMAAFVAYAILGVAS
jgi:hypothetical protein